MGLFDRLKKKPEPEKKPDESVQPEKTESRGEETK